MMKTGFVRTTDNGKLFYAEEGSGRPIVFIHGWSSTGFNSFGHLFPFLTDKARCIYYDLRGHGMSYSYNASSIARLTEDLHDLIIELDLHDVILVGHSLGGLIIYSYFEKYDGARVSGVAVLDMSPKVLCSHDWNHGLRTVPDPFGSAVEHAMQEMTYDFMVAKGWQLKMFSNIMSSISPLPYGSILYTLWLDMLDADYRNGAKKINVPMKYFGAKNGMYPRSVADWLSRNVSAPMKFIEMELDDHFTMLGEVTMIVPEIADMI